MWSECCNVGGRELGEWREGILASSLLSLGWGGAKLLASLEPQVPWPSPPQYPLAAWSLRSGWGLQLSRAAAVAFEVNTEKQQMLCWEGWVFIAGRPWDPEPRSWAWGDSVPPHQPWASGRQMECWVSAFLHPPRSFWISLGWGLRTKQPNNPSPPSLYPPPTPHA